MVRKYIPHCIISVLLLSLTFQCRQNRIKDKVRNKNQAVLYDTLTYYKNKLGTQTASIQTLQLEQQQLQENIIQKDKELTALTDEFREIRSVTKYKTTTQLDTIFIPFDKPLDSL